MTPTLLRHALGTLVACSGLLLTACNVTVGELSPDEPLGTHEAAMCASSSVSVLTIDGATIYQGELAAAGSWSVTYPANAIRIEYHVDATLAEFHEYPGTSGTWSYSRTSLACGTPHAFEVRAYPMVLDSSGLRATCLGNGPKKTSTSLSETCCTPETDAQFCSRLGMQCGPASGLDNCGNNRSVWSCGSCPSGSVCDLEGPTNVCLWKPCTPDLSCGGRCGCVSNGCGGVINCGTCPTQVCSGRTPYPCCDGSCSSTRFCPGVACDPAPGTCAEEM